MSEDTDLNRRLWSLVNAQHTDRAAASEWLRPDVRWGLYRIPEADLRVLPDLVGLRVVELGAGTAFLAAALARSGADVIAVDVSHEQLVTAARCQSEIGPSFPLIEAEGARVPLRDGIADLVVSEHGASVWCDPRAWVPEAARILRPGGLLIFLTNSVLSTLSVPPLEGPAEPVLHRAQRDLFETRWDGGGVEFHPSHGQWIEVLRGSGFTVEGLRELYAPDEADDPEYYEIADAEWARRWPVEDLWTARLGFE